MKEKQQALLSKFKEELNGHEFVKNRYTLSFLGKQFTTTPEQPDDGFISMDFVLPSKQYEELGLCLYIGFGEYINFNNEFIDHGFCVVSDEKGYYPGSEISYFKKNLKELGFTLVS